MGNTEAVIKWFTDRKGKVTYSMTNRLGPNSYDCSAAVFFALIEGGFLPKGTRIGNTEDLYDLEGSLLIPISRSAAKRGDLFVSGVKKNSNNANGHTGVFTSNSRIIHCTSSIGIGETEAAGGWLGGPPVYCYRLKGAGDEDEVKFNEFNGKAVAIDKPGIFFATKDGAQVFDRADPSANAVVKGTVDKGSSFLIHSISNSYVNIGGYVNLADGVVKWNAYAIAGSSVGAVVKAKSGITLYRQAGNGGGVAGTIKEGESFRVMSQERVNDQVYVNIGGWASINQFEIVL